MWVAQHLNDFWMNGWAAPGVVEKDHQSNESDEREHP